MTSHLPTPDRSPLVQVNIKNLIDEVQCYQTVRDLRWPDGITCFSCQSKPVIKRGFDGGRQRIVFMWVIHEHNALPPPGPEQHATRGRSLAPGCRGVPSL